MLTEAEMAAMADYFEDIYTKACDNIMAEIGKNIARTQDLTLAQAKAIQRMHLHSADMNRLEGILKQTSGKSFEDIKAVYDYTVADSYEWARPFYQNRGLTKIPARFNQSLKQMINAISQSSGKTLENLSRTTAIGVQTSKGFTPLDKFYKDTINKGILSVSTGTEGYQKAVRRAVQELGGSGLRVRYESGYTRRLDSAVRQNILDGMTYIAQESANIHGEAFGADGWELSAHSPCAPDHLPYQGLQFSKAEYEDLQASLARPVGEWNCRHIAYPIVLGVSGTANSKEELAEMKRYSNEKIEIDGREYTRYECTQLQRKLETEMRKAQEQRILYKNAGQKDLERSAREKLNLLGNKYKEVSNTAGLPTRAERMRIAQEKLKEKVAKIDERGIIKQDITIGRSVGAAAFRDDVLLPNGKYGKLAEGSQITKVYVFAGKGTDKPVRVANYLTEQFGGRVENWQHVRGEGIVDIKGVKRVAELHWFENKDVGRIKMKVKRWRG